MNNTPYKSIFSFGLTVLLAATSATAQIAVGTPSIDTSGSFQQEIDACVSGNTPQDRETCLTEARNAQAEKKRGALGNSSDKQSNAMLRCDVFINDEDNAACQARVMSLGSTEGSVAGGGVIRKVETVVLPAH